MTTHLMKGGEGGDMGRHASIIVIAGSYNAQEQHV